MESRGPERPNPAIGWPDHDAVRVFHHREEALGNTTVSIETLTGIDPVPDSAAHQQRVLEEQVANRMLQNRLDRLVAELGSPMTSASVGSGTFMQLFQYSGIEADSEPDNWARALEAIEQVLRQAVNHGFQPGNWHGSEKSIRPSWIRLSLKRLPVSPGVWPEASSDL